MIPAPWNGSTSRAMTTGVRPMRSSPSRFAGEVSRAGVASAMRRYLLLLADLALGPRPEARNVVRVGGGHQHPGADCVDKRRETGNTKEREDADHDWREERAREGAERDVAPAPDDEDDQRRGAPAPPRGPAPRTRRPRSATPRPPVKRMKTDQLCPTMAANPAAAAAHSASQPCRRGARSERERRGQAFADVQEEDEPRRTAAPSVRSAFAAPVRCEP